MNVEQNTPDLEELERLLPLGVVSDEADCDINVGNLRALIAKAREADGLRAENERLREIVAMLATFDARNSIVHLRDLARAALGEAK